MRRLSDVVRRRLSAGCLVVASVAVVGFGVASCAGAPADPGPGDPVKSSGPAIWGTVAGTVRDRAGHPVGGALVVPSALDNPAQPVPEIAITSGPDGGYEWHLRPGRYSLRSQIGTRHSAAVTVSVAAGLRVTADLTLPG